jgi:LAS superfamily LD-carboxypeptidase LdcB
MSNVKKHRLLPYIGLVLLLCIGAGYLIFTKTSNNNSPSQSTSQNITQEPERTELKKFSGPAFVELFYRVAHPNTQAISEDSKITGNQKADEHIKKLAERRGYKTQSAPVADVLASIAPNMLLQPKAAADWKKLVAKAKSQDIELEAIAAYRSEAEQLSIFLSRLTAKKININRIAGGVYDSQIDDVLATTALPGYSKHHNGYTVDIACANDQFVIFESSVCFAWLSSNNYQNAKESGWIPSYPKGAKKQGPKPEAWEYVWVGRDALLL